MTTEATDIRVAVTIGHGPYHSAEYLHFSAEVVKIERDRYDGKYRVVNFYGAYDDAERGLYGFGVNAQANVSDGASAQFYAYEPEYGNRSQVRERDLDAMVKVMRKVTRELNKIAATYGSARDLATFMPRFAAAVGATMPRPFVRYGERGQVFANGNTWQELDADDLASWIREELRKLAPAESDAA
jgi:hypothetical protein